MLDLNVTTQETNSFTPKVLSPGVKLVKINQLVINSIKEGSPYSKVTAYLEGPDQGEHFEGFKTFDDVVAKGLVGEIQLAFGNFDEKESNGTYLTATQGLINNLAYIAEKADVTTEFKAIKASTAEELIAGFNKIIQGKFVWLVLGGREYINSKDMKVLGLKELVGTNIKVGDLKYKQVYCKHKDFGTEVVIKDGVERLEGINVVGPNKGSKTYLDFQLDNTWYVERLKAEETPDSDPDAAEGTDDLPF